MTGRQPKRRRAAVDADEVERLRRENERLRRENAEQAKQIAEAEQQIADLERQLALRQQNSTTTSKPPSSDGWPVANANGVAAPRVGGGAVVNRDIQATRDRWSPPSA
jgi:uncharacterized protein HemX